MAARLNKWKECERKRWKHNVRQYQASQAIAWGGWGQSRESLARVLCVPAATRHRVTARAGFIGASAVKLSERAVRSTQYAMRLNGMAFRHKDVHTFDLREALSYRESVDSLWTVCGQSVDSRLAVSCLKCVTSQRQSAAQQLTLQGVGQSPLEDHRL